MPRFSLSPFTHTFTAGLSDRDFERLKEKLARLDGVEVEETENGLMLSAKQKQLLGLLYRGRIRISVMQVAGDYRFIVRFPTHKGVFLGFALGMSLFVLLMVVETLSLDVFLSILLIWAGSLLAFWGHLTPRVSRVKEFLLKTE